MSVVAQAGCDRSIAWTATPRGPDAAQPHPRLLLTTTILASSLAFIDGSVVNVGLPAIGRSLAANGASLAWVVNAYLLPLSALLLIGGAAGDRFGRRRLLTLGIGLFATASILCAAAPNLAWLLAARALQGAGAALLLPSSLAILGAGFTGEARGRAIGTWAAVGSAAGAGGPLIGGWLIDGVGWRAIFLLNIPIAVAGIYLALRFIREDRDPKPPALDLAGAGLATAALAALTWGLTVVSSRRGPAPASIAALIAGAVLLGLFAVVERRRGERAMLPTVLFSSPSFVGLTWLTLLLYGALGGLMVLVPYVLIETRGYSATAAGAALLPLPLVIAAASPSLGRLAGRIGPRAPLTAGPLIVALGLGMSVRIVGAGGYWTTTLPAMLVVAIGMACAVAPLTTAVLGSVDARHTGVASGFNSAVARTGGLVATALLGVVLAAHGLALQALYQDALWVGAIASLAAGLSAFIGLRPPRGASAP